MNFSVLIAIGNGPLEFGRLRDLIESLFHYESGVAEIVIVDDATPVRVFSDLAIPPTCRLVALQNPRRGAGDGWSGGLVAGILTGYAWLARNSTCEFVLKLDTDALVIAPFATKIAAAFSGRKEVFLLGSFTKTPTRKYTLPEDFSSSPALKKLQRLFTVWRRTWRPWPRVQCSLFGRDKARRRLIQAAVRGGYRLGMHCQGGAYAVSASALVEFTNHGIFLDPMLWIWTPCGEDVAVTISAYASGGIADDLNDDGQPFATVARGLPDAPKRLVERGFSIIHSVKDFKDWKETQTREYFRQQREGSSTASEERRSSNASDPGAFDEQKRLD